ncbi:glycosyltransferase family 2 protein [Aeromicrobium wangtongii]|uniref:glycosyltransferase family 2 protein n=1 Tax=Aeromicrobium wangtongii TaxID=2969247 RepID=UPI0020174B1A|nr:glycosyltransferase family 2 protein [Aeromicrobium wangtongii]MCL3817853.1 glycosyltransferase family 2 protein [Aeromicrobium wangtongii]
MIPDVVVVIVTYNSAPMIEGLLDSLGPALDGLSADVVVVDNGSSDATVQLARARADCRVVEAQNDGYSAGINRGVRSAGSGGDIVILNPDVRMDPGSIRVLLRALGEPAVGVSAPRVRSADGGLHHSLRRDPTLLRALGLSRLRRPVFSEHVQEDSAYQAAHDVDWALGAVLAVSRRCWDAVGPWDESFFLYSEETDFCLRARELGFRVRYEPAAGAVHIGAQSGQSDTIHTMQILNRVRLYRRRNGVLPSSGYFVATVLSELSWVARGHRQSRAAVAALLRPHRRPAQLMCADSLIPR